jgi:hypothetical protein
MHLPDVNVWLALTFDSHVHHLRAKLWFDALTTQAYFCRLTQQGFLRLATNPKAFGRDAVTMDDAWRLFDAFARSAGWLWVAPREPRLMREEMLFRQEGHLRRRMGHSGYTKKRRQISNATPRLHKAQNLSIFSRIVANPTAPTPCAAVYLIICPHLIRFSKTSCILRPPLTRERKLQPRQLLFDILVVSIRENRCFIRGSCLPIGCGRPALPLCAFANLCALCVKSGAPRTAEQVSI